MSNYRPISNLPYISKVLERVVSKQLNSHLESQSLKENLQSAYRSNHSTETALLRVANDTLMAIDKQNCVALILLDLSAAFDTVDHITLLNRLQHRFGVTDSAHKWFASYLNDRTQSVVINGTSSAPKTLSCCVPQGSVLGPELFTQYNSPLADLIRLHGVQLHLYADDSQLYLPFKPGISEHDCIKQLEACIMDVRKWMAQNSLKLNDDKSEFVIIGTKQQLDKVNVNTVQIGSSSVKRNMSARNIGVWFDENLKLKDHVQKVCQSAWFHLRNISKIRKYLTAEQTELVVHALITSRLDSNNCLLYGVDDYLLRRLQKVQNAAAKVIVRKRKHDHVTPILQALHWLPIKQRVIFKIALLVFKCMHDLGPSYLKELLIPSISKRSLRSTTANVPSLVIPRVKLKYGERSFSYSGPFIWNNLPIEVRSANTVTAFKGRLKTYLFTCAYPN